MGALLIEKLNALKTKHPFIKEARGKGLLIAIEFEEPKELKLRMAWQLIHKMDKSLFTQMIVTTMPTPAPHPRASRRAQHGRGQNPPAAHHRRKGSGPLRHRPRRRTSDCRKFPGPMWELGKNFFKSLAGVREIGAVGIYYGDAGGSSWRYLVRRLRSHPRHDRTHGILRQVEESSPLVESLAGVIFRIFSRKHVAAASRSS